MVGSKQKAQQKRTVKRADLVDAVYRTCRNLSRREAVALFDMVLAEVTSTLVQGEAVKLHAFGSFAVREKRERVGRNPKSGALVSISARRVLSFRPSDKLITAD